MKTLSIFTTFLSLAIYSQSSLAQGLSAVLDHPLNRASLDELTRSPETMNKATVLHLGKNSYPVRRQLIAEAQNHVFITVPYWFKDQTGETLFSDLKRFKENVPGADVKVLVDWVSPASTKDFFGLKFYKKIKEAFGKDNVRQWNKLWNLGRFSGKIWKNRMHDKLMVVDGKKLLMGGMNMGNDYLHGGQSPEGWHDTDILFEGPVAQQGSLIFLRPFLYQRFMDRLFSARPDTDRMELKVLQYLFYHNKEKVSFRAETLIAEAKSMEVPLRQYLDDPTYFPPLEQTPEMDTPVRLIYDVPLVDRQMVPHPKRKGVYESRHYSKLLNTLEFIMPRVKKSIRAFIPYITLSDRMTKILTSAAARGVKVEVITNSVKSHDLGKTFYKAGLPRVKELEEAGVAVFEWQGHEDLLNFEKEHGCKIDNYWPGNRLHTKLIILDGEVSFLGSHNFNTRSEKHNSEIMAMIRSPKISKELEKIFEYDLDRADSPEQRTIACGGKLMTGRPERSKRIDLKELQKTYDFKKLERLKRLYDLI